MILQSPDSTIVIPPDATAAPDAAGNVVVTFGTRRTRKGSRHDRTRAPAGSTRSPSP